VVAFPVHLPLAEILARGSVYGVKVGDGEPKGRIGDHGQAQCRDCKATVYGPLCPSVPGRRLSVCRDGTAMVLDRKFGVRATRRTNRLLIMGLLHGYQVEPAA
jgi:hypothetical protein